MSRNGAGGLQPSLFEEGGSLSKAEPGTDGGADLPAQADAAFVPDPASIPLPDPDPLAGKRDAILLGDCVAGMEALPAGCADMIFCDLPYGTTQNKWDVVIPFEDLWRAFEHAVKKDGAIVLTATQPFTSLLVASNLRLFKYSWVWEKSLKTNFLNAKKQPLRQHEDVLVFYAKQPLYVPQGLVPGSISGGNKLTGSYGAWTPGESKQEMTGYPTSILKIPNPNQGNIHPTQKPVPLVEYFIRTYTRPGEVVLDACMGSGSTAVAARNTGRYFVGFELDPVLRALSLERLARNDGR